MKSRIPKVLHRICGKAMLEHVVDAAKAGGFSRVIIVSPPNLIEKQLSLGNENVYVEQPEPLGTGDALSRAKNCLEGTEHFAVLSGDVPLITSDTLIRMRKFHIETNAYITLLTARKDVPGDLGRIIRDADYNVSAIVEQKDADENTLALNEVNAGVYFFNGSWLWKTIGDLSASYNGEIYLTDLVSVAFSQGKTITSVETKDSGEILGVNTRVHLAEAECLMRQRIRDHWMMAGITIPDPRSVYIDCNSELGQDTVLLPNTHIVGGSRVGQQCNIGPNSVIDNSVIGDRSKVKCSMVENSITEEEVEIGPFSHVREDTYLEHGVKVGNYSELKNSRLGHDTKSGHFSYIGDASVGANVNIGAGTVTCNFDGEEKHRTVIGDDAFIGSGSMLIAPLKIGSRSVTGAGAVVNREVPENSLVKGVPAKISRKKSFQCIADGG